METKQVYDELLLITATERRQTRRTSRISQSVRVMLTGLLLLVFSAGKVFACEVCKKNQPEVLQDVSHGTGAQADLDYIIIWSAVIIVGITLFLSVKFLIRPNEGRKEHIKNIVVENLY